MSFTVTQIWILEVYLVLEVEGRLIGMIQSGVEIISLTWLELPDHVNNRKTPTVSVITVLKFFTGDVLPYCLNAGYSA